MPDGRRRVLLVIDQFEELFTITEEQARRRFLDAIASAVSEPDTQITVLLSLRADYYDRPLLHPEFAKVFTPGVENALPMTPNELEAVVVGPAEHGGLPSSRRSWQSLSPMRPIGREPCRSWNLPSPSCSTSEPRPR